MKPMLLISLILSFQTAFAVQTSNPSIQATFRYAPAMSGSCIDKSNQDSIADVLSSFGMTQKDLPASQQIILKNALKHMGFLHGSALKNLRGTKVRYFADLTKVYARQTLGPIDIGPRSLNNYAVYTHELGHVVGNSLLEGTKSRVYDVYNKTVATPCHFSSYSKVSHGHGARNEEFAEVFAAYLLTPQVLLNAGPECRQAHDNRCEI